jgi:hypothetical protein
VKFIDNYTPLSGVGVTVAVSVWSPGSGSFVQSFEADLNPKTTEYFDCDCSAGDSLLIMIAIYPPKAKPKISYSEYAL